MTKVADQHLTTSGVAERYPEKTYILSRIFTNTTNSYKIIWFLAILSLLKKRDDRTFPLMDVFSEMLVVAWHPVCFYRLSLGKQDKLQDAITDIKMLTGLKEDAAADVIRAATKAQDITGRLEFLRRYVTRLFLSPWFAEHLQGIKSEHQRNLAIERMATESQTSPDAAPYYFAVEGTRVVIRINEAWRFFFLENMGLIQSFAEYNFAQYLQARNPNVPGIINKLAAPSARQLRAAREFWRMTQRTFKEDGMAALFKDIYSQVPLIDTFAIDHFLPWSFVVHDLLWNLTPVEQTTNSQKGNAIPNMEVYLPPLAMLHFSAITAARKRPTMLEDYAICFKQEPEKLLALGKQGFLEKFREVFIPQAQIAKNQGFQADWVLQK